MAALGAAPGPAPGREAGRRRTQQDACEAAVVCLLPNCCSLRYVGSPVFRPAPCCRGTDCIRPAPTHLSPWRPTTKKGTDVSTLMMRSAMLLSLLPGP